MSRSSTTAGASWSRRLLRYHLPLALASIVAVVLWLNLPLFRAAGHRATPTGVAQTQATGHERQAGHSAPARGAGHAAPAQADRHTAPALPAQAAAAPSTDHSASLSADAIQNRGFMARLTTATGYVALALLAATLLVGPLNLLFRRRNPVSSYLRRDVGTWTAILSIVHVVAGFQVHGPPLALGERILHYFFSADGRPLTNEFGLGNWTGLAATVIVVGLLALSSDAALRRLKAGPWKRLQRLNYALFALVLLHAIYYGALSRVPSPSTLLLALSAAAVIVGQTAGIWLWRRRYTHALAQPA